MRVHAGCVRSSSARSVQTPTAAAAARAGNARASPNAPQVAGGAASAFGQRFGGQRGIGRERALDRPCADVSCARPAVVGYTGVRRSGSGVPCVDDRELRMHDLAAEMAVAHVAEDAHARPRRERLLLARIEVERSAARAVRARRARHRASRHTSWRRGRYWISAFATTVPSACCTVAPERTAPAERRACGPRSAAAGAARDPPRAARRGARACRPASRRVRSGISLPASPRVVGSSSRTPSGQWIGTHRHQGCRGARPASIRPQVPRQPLGFRVSPAPAAGIASVASTSMREPRGNAATW